MTRHAPRQLVVAATVLVTMLALVAVPSSWRLTSTAAAAPPAAGGITLRVASARTVSTATPPTGGHFIHKGDAVSSYKWLVTADDAGDPNDSKANCLPPRGRTPAAPDSSDPGYTNRCQWPSARYTAGNVPVVAQGTEADLSTS